MEYEAYKQLDISPTSNGKFVVITSRCETFAFDTADEVLIWLKGTGLRKSGPMNQRDGERCEGKDADIARAWSAVLTACI